jgi:hypothetical protein
MHRTKLRSRMIGYPGSTRLGRTTGRAGGIAARILASEVAGRGGTAAIAAPPTEAPQASAVVGSISRRTRATLFAGKPPLLACCLTASSSAAM